jgi:hypothetical protein
MNKELPSFIELKTESVKKFIQKHLVWNIVLLGKKVV